MDAYDLNALFAIRERLGAAASPEPALTPLGPVATGRRIACLSGSFNPPTSAHLLMAERALAQGFDAVVYALPLEPAGKRPSGLCMEDRLLALSAVAEPPAAIAISSHGLYVDQAAAARTAFPGSEVAFLVGSDKLAEIFDASWYDDRDAALDELFSRVRLLVAPRGDAPQEVQAMLRSYPGRASRIETLPLHPAVGDVSSTRVRGLLASGADSSGLLPEPIGAFCATTRAFAPPDADTGADAYALRVRAIDLLWSHRDRADSHTFRAIVESARSDARVRALLEDGDAAVLEAL